MRAPRPSRASYERTPAPDQEWAARGACARHPDPDMWFTDGDDEQRHQDAIALCRTCPVIQACLGYALSIPNLPGIWGGTTQTARTRLRNQSRPDKAA